MIRIQRTSIQRYWLASARTRRTSVTVGFARLAAGPVRDPGGVPTSQPAGRLDPQESRCSELAIGAARAFVLPSSPSSSSSSPLSTWAATPAATARRRAASRFRARPGRRGVPTRGRSGASATGSASREGRAACVGEEGLAAVAPRNPSSAGDSTSGRLCNPTYRADRDLREANWTRRPGVLKPMRSGRRFESASHRSKRPDQNIERVVTQPADGREKKRVGFRRIIAR